MTIWWRAAKNNKFFFYEIKPLSFYSTKHVFLESGKGCGSGWIRIIVLSESWSALECKNGSISALKTKFWSSWMLTTEPWRVCGPLIADSHRIWGTASGYWAALKWNAGPGSALIKQNRNPERSSNNTERTLSTWLEPVPASSLSWTSGGVPYRLFPTCKIHLIDNVTKWR